MPAREFLCAVCRTANAADHRFCKQCGQPLRAGAGEAAAVVSDEGERRQLTVMFCDLVGSTRLSARLDPEELRHVVGEYQRVCAEVIERNQGHIAQYLGDGVLAYFGYPRAHEDDARLAVRAGLGVVEAVRALGASLGDADAETLAVRVGIHTGPVVVGPMAGDRSQPIAIGETPNLAARLQTSAEPETVLISGATHRLTQGAFVYEPLGARPLRGLSHPVEVFRVVREASARRHDAPAGVASALPFIGREQELGFLLERWELVKEGRGQVVMLVGEPGIGKSRLVDMMREWLADEQLTVLESRGSAHSQSSALYAAGDLVERLLDLHKTDAPGGTLAALEAAVDRHGLARPDIVPWLGGLLSLPHDERYAQPPLSPQTRKQRTLDAIHRLFLAAAAMRPLCIVVEDLHWIDPSTLELLTLLVEHGPTARVFTLLTARPEFQAPWTPRSHVTQITLNRFTRRQSIAMIERLTGGRSLPSEVLAQIVAKTDGVPLFVEELTKTVLESGLLRDEGDHYALASALPTLAIPATLQDSLAARLDRLGPAKSVAQVAAVLGREFSYELLQAVSPMADDALRRGVELLVEAELVYLTSAAPQATYVFKHALVQDAAYQSLLRTTRQRYHRRTAEVLVERFPETTELQPELVAHHFDEAGLTESAVTYWQRAGQRAIERSANAEAIGHLGRALDLVRAGADTSEARRKELELQTALGAVLMAAKGYAAPDVERAYARARDLCEQLGETSQLFATLRGLWGVHVVRADLQRAHDLGNQCLALAQQSQSAAALLWAHYALGMTVFHLGDGGVARRHFGNSLALYDPDKRRIPRALQDPAVSCLSYTAVVEWLGGRPDTARRTSLEAIAMAEKLSHPFSVAYALYIAAVVSQLSFRVDEVRARAEAAAALSAEHGMAFFLPWGRILGGWALAAQGQDEEGVEEQRRGLDAYAATGAALARPYFLALLAEVHQSRGRVTEAGGVLREAFTLIGLTGERWLEPELYRLQGEQTLAVSASEAATAERWFRHAIELAEKNEQTSLALRAALSLGCLLRAHDRTDEARHLVSGFYGRFTEGFDTRDLREAAAFLKT
jgi:class 3 adenylate cyclase/predicted ATPase